MHFENNVYIRSAATRALSEPILVHSNSENLPNNICDNYFDFTDPLRTNYVPKNNNPIEIECKIDHDFPIIEIHQLVKDRIYFLNLSVYEYDREISEIDFNINSGFLPPIQYYSLTLEKNEKNEKKRKILEANYWQRYCNSVIPILNKYVELIPNYLFDNSYKNSNISFDDEKIEERINCIFRYIEIVCSLNIIIIRVINICNKNNFKKICPGCNNEIISKDSFGDDGKITCLCGFIENGVNKYTEYDEFNKLSTKLSNNEDYKVFTDLMDNFLGRSGISYPKEEMFEKFNQYCEEKNLPIGIDVKNGLISQPKLEILITLLQNNGYSIYYPLKNIIRHEYYGWKIPEVSISQENQGLNLFLNIQEKYKMADNFGRKIKLNKEIVFCICLKLVGVETDFNDFKTPKSKNVISFAKNVLTSILLSLGYEEHQIFDIL